MISYVDLDTMEVCSKIFLLKKYSMAKAADAPLTANDLEAMNAAILDETGAGDMHTGKAVFNGDVYEREYRGKTTAELISQERNWRDQQFPLVEIAMNRVQDNHKSEVGLVSQWRAYRNALRDYPQGTGFPDRTLNPRPMEPE